MSEAEENDIPTPVDATTNLSEQLATATALLAQVDGDGEGEPEQLKDGARRLARLVLELSDWLENGGDLPDPWHRSPESSAFGDGEETIADPDASPF